MTDTISQLVHLSRSMQSLAAASALLAGVPESMRALHEEFTAAKAELDALDASATLAWTSPVIGSQTSAVRPDVPFTSLPPMKCPIERMKISLGPGRFESSPQGAALQTLLTCIL